MSFVLALLLLSQNISQRGYVETDGTVYPRPATNDSTPFVGGALLRDEVFYRPRKDLQISGGIDVRTDTHHEVEREFHMSSSYWQDRAVQRPLFSIRRLSAAYHRVGFNLEVGKQFVRWGRADILNPTDRFAPRDLLTVVDKEFMPINAVRATYSRGAETFDAVWEPRFTPSRIPLQNQRWFPVPSLPPGAVLPTLHFRIPNGSSYGFRWSHVGLVEFSVAYYQGYNDIPSLGLSYPKLRMVGGDAAVPFRWLTIKTETAYLNFSDRRADNYVQYVIQAERQMREWFFVGGYAGEAVTQHGTQVAYFNPDRGMTSTILARAGYTIDSRRSVAMESAIRQNGQGRWTKLEYSHAYGQHWRLTWGASLFRGSASDFLGQYARNSRGTFAVKYSF